MASISLIDDPRWPAFVERYAFDAERFAIEVCCMEPTWQQSDLLNSVSPFGSRTSVSSGHGCFAAGTMMMRADGSPGAVEDIEFGDKLMGPDGKSSRIVLEVIRGREAMVKITYSGGYTHTVNRSHNLAVCRGLEGDLEIIKASSWLDTPADERAPYSRRLVSQPGTAPRYELIRIDSAEELPEADYFGFILDGDHLFLDEQMIIVCNTGKTASFGVLCLWHLCCFAKSNTYLTAPKLKTLQEGVWQEINNQKDKIIAGDPARGINGGPHAWIADYIIIESEKVYIKGYKAQWFVSCRTAPLGKPEALAGTHNKFLLWLADEASGIPSANFQVIGGALTDKRNRFVIASQPTRSSGFFYETHHKLSNKGKGRWNSLVFNSEMSPIVSVSFILDKRLEYGGRSSPEYCIKVLGQFPENSDKYILGRTTIEKRIGADPVIKNGEFFGNLVIVDVGAGVYRDKTIAHHFKVLGNGDRMEPDPRRVEAVSIPVFSNALDWTPVARIVADYCARLSNCTVVVDAHGMGNQFAKRLEEFGVPNVIKSYWGNKPFSKRYKERFYNLRAQCTIHAKEAIEDGRITFGPDYQSDLLDQGSRIPFFIDETGKWHIARKEDMAKEGIPSPDLFDTVCMAFLEGVTYIESDSMPVVADSEVGEAASRVTENLSGLDFA